MTVQELRSGDKAAGRRKGGDAAPRQVPGGPAFGGECKGLLARWEAERAAQQEIFEARREEMLAAHPGKHIAVCEGEVLVADTALGAAQLATKAHIDHAAFYYSPRLKGQTEGEAYAAEIAKSQKETDQQQEIFEARREEILAAHPGKHIAVCEGEVLVADTSVEIDQEVMRKHPGHPAFFYSPGITCVTMF